MSQKKKPTPRGGRRPGAGRKPANDEPALRYNVTLPSSLADRIRAFGKSDEYPNGNLSAGIRKLAAKLKGK